MCVHICISNYVLICCATCCYTFAMHAPGPFGSQNKNKLRNTSFVFSRSRLRGVKMERIGVIGISLHFVFFPTLPEHQTMSKQIPHIQKTLKEVQIQYF